MECVEEEKNVLKSKLSLDVGASNLMNRCLLMCNSQIFSDALPR